MLKIFPKTATAFDTLGDGQLLPTACIVNEDLNGAYELTMAHPYDEYDKWRRIEKEKILIADTPNGKQPFRIYNVKPDMTEINVNARHIFYDLLDNLIISLSYSGNAAGAIAQIKQRLSFAQPFIFATNLTNSGSLSLSAVNPVSALLSTADRDNSFKKSYGGELMRDGWNVSMLTTIGNDGGVRIAYGKNLIGLEVTEDIAGTVTRIYPIGKDGLTAGFVDSPHIGDYLYPKIYVLEDSQLTSTSQLINAAQAIFNAGGDLPQVNIKVDFAELSKTVEYEQYKELETVHLGDVVTVINSKMGFSKKAKVISYEYDALRQRYNAIELGDFLPTLVTSVTTGTSGQVIATSANSEINTHVTDFNNPHRVQPSQVGVGDLSQLKTTAKSNIVAAINELFDTKVNK